MRDLGESKVYGFVQSSNSLDPWMHFGRTLLIIKQILHKRDGMVEDLLMQTKNDPAEIARCGCDYCDLVETVRQLRDPDGCPWDVEQTHVSLRANLLEECFETLEALDAGDAAALKEELGDLLIQVVFHADIARRSGAFDAYEVCAATHEKLRRRHPHVFGDATAADSAEDVMGRWERIKREESGGVRSIVASVPRDLPAVALASILIRRASRAGLDLREYAGVSVGSVNQLGDDELSVGKWLMSKVSEVQSGGMDAESALRVACNELRDRVLRAERLAKGTALSDLSESERDAVWRDAAVGSSRMSAGD